MVTIAATTAPALLAQTHNGVPQRARSRVTAALSIVLLAEGMGIYGGVDSGNMTEGKVYAVGNLLQSNAGGGVRAVVARYNVSTTTTGLAPRC
jgi:hypothetical protein